MSPSHFSRSESLRRKVKEFAEETQSFYVREHEIVAKVNALIEQAIREAVEIYKHRNGL